MKTNKTTNKYDGLKINDIILNIGTIVLCIYKKYVDEKIEGGKIIVCRVKTFENKQGIILPVLTEVGNSKRELNSSNYYLYYNINSALKALTTKK